MKANELKYSNCVGFYIERLNETFTGVITAINKDYVYVNEIKVSIEKLKPIPITEEWLVKFGFYFKPFDKIFYTKKFNESHWIEIIPNNGKFRIIVNSEFAFDFPVKLQYVHQLQNLYLDLTGEELTIKK